jgi:outer membrane biosynthesis protein TonB
MRYIVLIFLLMILTLTTSLADLNDTATSTNILPNAGDTTSSLSNANLDGVQSGTGELTNNSIHNGFTITCETQVNNACGYAFSGELEASHDLKVSANGSLIGITGIDESSNSHTSTQAKLNGGIQLDSFISIQNCEWSGSSYQCGNSAGTVDTYKLHIKIKDSEGTTLAEMTTVRTNDAGYYSNSQKFEDTLVYNGVDANTWEWYWQGIDGSESTSSITMGPNLLGAELGLDFPTEDHILFTTEEIEELNEALGTANLNESEIWDVISGIESILEEKIYETGINENTKVEVILEENMTVSILTSTAVTEEVKEVIEEVKKEETIQVVKQQVVTTLAAKKPANIAKQIIQTTTKKEMVNEKEEKQEAKKQEIKEEKKENKQEKKKVTSAKEETSQQEESSSTSTTTKTVSTKNNTKQKKVQSEKVKANIKRIMAKVDEQVKDLAKNLEVKNIIKLQAMISDQASLDLYSNIIFYIPKDIYLNQIPIFDNRLIYDNIRLTNYIVNDKVFIKEQKLNDINMRKQRLLIEIQELKNG